jgi:hypothetical protein
MDVVIINKNTCLFSFYIVILHRIQCYDFHFCCPCYLTCNLCIGVGTIRGIQRKGKLEPAAI